MLPIHFPLTLCVLVGAAGLASSTPQFSAIEETKLVPTSPPSLARFGHDVAIDGDTALMAGAAGGGVYVYVRSGATWIEQAFLTPSGLTGANHPVDLDGDVAVISAYFAGSVYVFRRTGTVWVEEQELVTSNQAYDAFGQTLAISGDTIVVGAREFGIFDKGKAFVFQYSGGVWTQVQELQGGDTNKFDAFGEAIDLDGDTLAISSYHDHAGGSALGTTYVFARSAGVWTEQAELTDPVEHRGLHGLSGERLLLGSSAGGLVFERSGTAWSQTATLAPTPAQVAGLFGYDAALDGDVAVFGIPFHNGAEPGNPQCNSGAASVFTFDGATWSERQEFAAADAGCGDRFGLSVALDGDSVIVGAPEEQLLPAHGKAYTFRIGPDSPVNYCTAGISAIGCSPVLQASGIASVSANTGFRLTAAGAPGATGGSLGLFFYGTSGRQAASWGNGSSYGCVTPPLRRLGVLSSGGTSGACDGNYGQDLNALWCPGCPKPQLNPGLGTTVQAQLWYSDPASTSNQSAGLSDAVEFAVGF